MEGVFFPTVSRRTTGVSQADRSMTIAASRYSSATSAQSSVRRRFTSTSRVPHTGHEAPLGTETPQ
jgi:hypothetical protein